MRCPKCQYVGFEPSPRCKNCGYDFSFSGDDLSTLTMTTESSRREAIGDFDLQLLDAPPETQAPARSRNGFDLDDLLATGRSQVATDTRPRAHMTASAVATPPAEDVLRIVTTAGDDDERVAPVVSEPQPVVVRLEIPMPQDRAMASAPVTTELPLFMQVMSEAAGDRSMGSPRDSYRDSSRGGMSLTIESVADMDDLLLTPAADPVEEVDDTPLVQVPAVLRQPLAVRRATPDPARLRAKYARAAIKADSNTAGDLLQGLQDVDDAAIAPALEPVSPVLRMSAEPTPHSLPAGWLQGVSAGKRVTAAAVDVLLLGTLNAAIVWFTLSVCGIAPSQALLLPLIPIGLFMLLLDGGYLILFTAACGQTIGKMAAGIRVVGTTTGAVIKDRISMGQAVARAIATMASCLPLGVGFWFGLMGDGRAFHDRIAHTRVVRA